MHLSPLACDFREWFWRLPIEGLWRSKPLTRVLESRRYAAELRLKVSIQPHHWTMRVLHFAVPKTFSHTNQNLCSGKIFSCVCSLGLVHASTAYAGPIMHC